MKLKVRWLAAHDRKSHRSVADEVDIRGGALILRSRRSDGKQREFIVPPGAWWNASTEEIVDEDQVH